MSNPLNIFNIAKIWRQAFHATDKEQFFRTFVPTASGKSESMPIPNLGSRCIGIALHGSIEMVASAAENAVSGARIIDIFDNIIITDSAGKTRYHMKPRTLYNIISFMQNEPPRMDALTNFAGAGSSTFTFDIVIPVSIAPDEGIYHMQFDYNITNCYAADVAFGTCTIDAVALYADADVPPIKITDIVKPIVSGNNMITELESNRAWYGVLIQGLSALTDIDDVSLKSGNEELISGEYPDIWQRFLAKIDYTPTTGDTMLSFRPHVRTTTDYFNLEGTASRNLLIAVICEPDLPVRKATVPEIRSPTVSPLAGATVTAPATGATITSAASMAGKSSVVLPIKPVPLTF